jgi:hypothetical protein
MLYLIKIQFSYLVTKKNSFGKIDFLYEPCESFSGVDEMIGSYGLIRDKRIYSEYRQFGKTIRTYSGIAFNKGINYIFNIRSN